MSSDEKRAAKIMEAANAAISKMTDPIKRTTAKHKLTIAKKKIINASRHSQHSTARTQQAKDRELDFDR